MTKKYDDITNLFLLSFQEEWLKQLEKMNLNQSQLESGSRLRPQIVLWGYLAGIDWNNKIDLEIPVQAAISLELIHKASLLLDDWIDDDDERHGKKAFHSEYGEHVTVMTATKMVSEAINNMLDLSIHTTNSLELVKLIVRTTTSMSDGILSELNLDKDTILDLDLVKHIAQLETSEIIGNSLLIGYRLNPNTTEHVALLLKTMGDLSGALFQTLNDLEAFSNLYSNIEHKGRENFDFNRNRKNIVVAYLYSLLSNKEIKKITSLNISSILSLYESKNIKTLILREMDIIFNEIDSLIINISNNAPTKDWEQGYTYFMNILKQTALKRVSLD